MTSHQLLMQAVGEFWARLGNVEPPGIHDPASNEYECRIVPGQRHERMLTSQEYNILVDAETMERLARGFGRYADELALRRVRPSRNLLYFQVFFPSDDKLSPFRTQHRESGLERNAAWWAFKRGIDLKHCALTRTDAGQTVMSVMLPMNDEKKKSRPVGGYACDVLRLSQIHDPANFGGVLDAGLIYPLNVVPLAPLAD